MALPLDRAVDVIRRTDRLDGLAATAAANVKRLVGKGGLKDVLSGTWLGHPLHPMLTDIPIGSFTAATALDLLGGEDGHRAAGRLTALGVITAVPTALAGAADWSETYGEDQRIGVVHGLSNLAGVTLFALSLPVARRSRLRGLTLRAAGMAALSVGGYLGGTLSYTRGVGVNNTFFQHPPTEWTRVLPAGDLAEGKPVCADAAGVPVLLYRSDGTVSAIANRCSHAGGPLADGDVDAEGRTVTCPWHGSVFSLDDGSVVHGPATAPQPSFETREQDGYLEVRLPTGH